MWSRVLFGSGFRRCAGGSRRGQAAWGPGLRARSTQAAEGAGTKAEAAQNAGGGGGGGVLVVGIAALGAAGWYGGLLAPLGLPAPDFGSSKDVDYGKVRAAIVDILDNEDFEDGSYGPILVRLAWHAAGTFDKESGSGGSNGATMRFSPECDHGANAGLKIARDLLEPIKKKYPNISYADLWTLAGVVAIEEMGGPKVAWSPGRTDADDSSSCPPDGRLPDASKGSSHIRDIFYRMGFNDQEIVALSGAHTLGRCHPDRSGFVNPWTNAPTTFSNLFFQDLRNKKWRKKKWSGPLQYEDKSGELMMLPTDMALIWDRKFRKHVDVYAKDEEKFFEDFSQAFSKLLALGVPVPQEETKKQD